MIRKLFTKRQFSNAIVVLCPENNTIAHAKLIEEALNNTHRDLKKRVCLLYECKADPTRPGIVTTQEVNICYQTQDALRCNRLRYWSGFFTTNTAQGATKMKDIFVQQLHGYQFVEASNVANRDVLTKTAKVVTTGKVGGAHDDSVDACELSMIGRLLFMSNRRKYAAYIRE